MSVTATMLYPAAPPPTKNTLDKEQRSRLLRSSRKLGSVLGTTPLVLDPDTEAEMPSSRNAPTRGHVKRHFAGLFQTSQSASSSSSSLSVASSSTAISTNSDYVFVRSSDARSRSRAAGALHVQAVFDNASPSSSRSASPYPGAIPRTPAAATTSSGAADHSATGVSRKRKQQAAGDSAGLAAPLNHIFPIPGPSAGSKPAHSGASMGSNIALKLDKGRATGTSATGAGHPSQPMLLHLRSVPASMNTTGDINNNRISHLDDHTHSPTKPLSPATSTFNMNMNVDVLLPPSPSTMSVNVHTHGLSDRARRRKMAKLARTLGENIPPELVFGAASLENKIRDNNINDNVGSSSTGHPTTLIRRASASAAATLRRKNLQDRDQALESFAPFQYNHTKPTPQFNATASLPPLAVAAVPQPPTRNSSDDQHRPQYHNRQPEWERQEPQPAASQLRPAAQVEKLAKRRLNRPRSLTLGTASAFAAASALLSRKAEPEPEPEPEHAVSDSIPVAVPVPIIVAPAGLSPKHVSQADDIVPSRGTTSLDLESLPSSPRPRPAQTHARAQTYYDGGAISGLSFNIDDPLPSPRPFVHVVDATPFDLARSSIDSSRPTGPEMAGTLTVDWGRRKEREWSGEWNLKDMEDVAKKLRGLKGR